MSNCITPGCCTCPNMRRCPGCGYTKHDKDFWLDHRLCEYHMSGECDRSGQDHTEVTCLEQELEDAKDAIAAMESIIESQKAKLEAAKNVINQAKCVMIKKHSCYLDS